LQKRLPLYQRHSFEAGSFIRADNNQRRFDIEPAHEKRTHGARL